MPKHMHDGHRERMRARIEKNGILSLEPHEVLEYLLYGFIPRKDTNAIAHDLLDRFGTLSEVFYAPPHKLGEVPGMTDNAVLFLNTLPDIFHRYLMDVVVKDKPKTVGNIEEYMGSLLYNCPAETVCIAALDLRDNVISCDVLSSGERSEVQLDVKSVVDYAQRHKAYGIILAHNHPSGNLSPSTADMSVTFEICTTLHTMGFRLLDHLIFCGRNVYSFEKHGHIQYFMGLHNSLKEGAWSTK